MSTPQHPPSSLSPEWAGQLAQALRTESAPSDEAVQRMKTRIQSAVRIASNSAPANSATLRSLRRDQAWKRLSSRVHVKLLHDDGQSFSWLLKLLPGGRLLEHDHADGAEECMVLEGSLRLNGEEYSASDYQIALPGSVHHEVSSEHGCLVYLRSPSSRRKELML